VKRLWLLLILLALLVAAYFVLRQRAPREKLRPVVDVDSLNIARIEIADAKGALVLERVDSRWQITKPAKWEAESGRMKVFIEDVISQKYATTPLDQGREALKTYRLDDDKALRISVFDKKNKLRARLWFSNLGNPFDYFRFEKSDKVFQIRSKVAGIYGSDFTQWRSPHVLSYRSDDLLTIAVKHPKNQYTLSRRDTLWHYKDSREEFDIPPGNVTMGKILNVLTMLNSYSLLTGDERPPADSLGSLECEVELMLATNLRRRLEFFGQGDRYLMRVDSDDSQYFVVLFDTVFRFTRYAALFRARVGVLPPSS
jgi:hypothetical protein